MEILVLSDSHGYTSKLIKILQRHTKIEFVIHLGDFGYDLARISEFLPKLKQKPFMGIVTGKDFSRLKRYYIWKEKGFLLPTGIILE